MRYARSHWPVLAATAIFLLSLAGPLALSLRQNGGILVYALDDPYIHMAMAKNLVTKGVWGVTDLGFTSSSSSPLWTMMISVVYFLIGPSELVPFGLNAALAITLLLWLWTVLRRDRSRTVSAFLALLAIIFLTPLPSLVFCGQEHTLHVLLTLAFAHASSRAIAEGQIGMSCRSLPLALAPLLTATRYEGLFLVFVVCCLFAARGRMAYALWLGVVALVPALAYGLASLMEGWFFLPNPLIIKGHWPDFASWKDSVYYLGYGVYRRLALKEPHLLVLILATSSALYLQLRARQTLWDIPVAGTAMFIAAALLHLQFAQTGWFYRYEAYLVALGLFVLASGFSEFTASMVRDHAGPKLGTRASGMSLALAALVAISPLVVRGINSTARIPRATANIHDQQYQMGLFLKEYYQSASVAANDIGAINYLADIECLDLAGLANYQVASAIRGGTYTPAKMSELAQAASVQIAVLYDDWYDVPEHWIKVGEWTIQDNVVCGGDTVSFYAVHPSQARALARNLRAFSPRLPSTVLQSGNYVGTGEADGDA